MDTKLKILRVVIILIYTISIQNDSYAQKTDSTTYYFFDLKKEKHMLALIYCNCNYPVVKNEYLYNSVHEIYPSFFKDRKFYFASRSTARDFPSCITYVKNNNNEYPEMLKINESNKQTEINELLSNLNVELTPFEKVLLIMNISDYHMGAVYFYDRDSVLNNINNVEIKSCFNSEVKLKSMKDYKSFNFYKNNYNEIVVYKHHYDGFSRGVVFEFDNDFKFIESIKIVVIK